MLKAWLKVAVLRYRWWLSRRRVSAALSADADLDKMTAAVFEVERYKLTAEKITTEYLIKKATRLGLDPPPDDWFYSSRIHEPGSITTVTVLTPLGKSKLRRNILLEKRMRWDFWLTKIPVIVTALTGLLGAVIGLLALLKVAK
jgi:hypothetical protein